MELKDKQKVVKVIGAAEAALDMLDLQFRENHVIKVAVALVSSFYVGFVYQLYSISDKEKRIIEESLK